MLYSHGRNAAPTRYRGSAACSLTHASWAASSAAWRSRPRRSSAASTVPPWRTTSASNAARSPPTARAASASSLGISGDEGPFGLGAPEVAGTVRAGGGRGGLGVEVAQAVGEVIGRRGGGATSTTQRGWARFQESTAPARPPPSTPGRLKYGARHLSP